MMADGKQGTLSSGITRDLNRLKYFLCEKKMFEDEIFKLFERQDDPYQYFLQLLPLAKYPKSNRPNKLTSAIISNFEVWTKNSPNLSPPSATHQSSALNLPMSLLEDMMEKILRIFQIDGKDDFNAAQRNLSNGNLETFVLESAVAGNKFLSREKLMHQSMAQSDLASFSGVEEDFDRLMKHFNDKTMFKFTIYKFFDSQDDPYQYFLRLINLAKSPNSNKVKKPLSEIFSCFEVWTKETANLAPPSATHQASALDWAMSFGNGNILETISRIFRIDEKNSFGLIIEHLGRGNLEMVSQAVKLLNLQKEYSFEQLYFPLLCLNLKKDLKNCLKNFKDLQQQFIENMDKLFRIKQTLFDAIKFVARKFPMRRKSIIDKEKYYWAAMDEFLKDWNIPIEHCKNFMLGKRSAAIFHLAQLYKKNEISIEALAEMAEIVVGNENVLAERIVAALKRIDPDAALILNAKLKNLPISYDEYNNFSTDEYLQLSLSEDRIIFVNNQKTYERSIEDISKFKEIGFDTESLPQFGWDVEKLALLQIATLSNIYLFDVISLSKCLSNNWDSFGKKVFYNNDILKIGYGIKTDLDHLEEVIMGNEEKHVAKKLENFMDLHTFCEWVSKRHPEIGKMLGLHIGVENSPKVNDGGGGAETSKKNGVNKKKSTKPKGLSGLCQSVLGKPLNKLEKISNWEQRPLRKAQKLYAALDAFCLLQILRKLEDELNKLGCHKTDTIKNFFKEIPPHETKKKNKKAQ